MKKIFMIAGLLLMMLVLLTACGGGEDEYEGLVKVTYYLEGGTYQNSVDPVTHYYDFEAGTENKIKDPTDLSNKNVERPGYTLEGWYARKNGTGDSATYSDKWDFEKNKVTDKGVTLYAKWEKNINYTFDLYYKDKNGNDIALEKGIKVDAGQPVTSAFVSLAENTMIGNDLTPLGQWTDAAGNAWNIDTDVHPGGETDTNIRLYAKYIDGKYTVVRTAKDLAKAVGGNIYLMNDIDFAGGAFGGFGDYTGVLLGNGYKIRNFTLTYTADKNSIKPDTSIDAEGANLLQISLFESLTGATIQDVAFENYTVEISLGMMFGTTKIVVAPFAMKMSDTTLANVTVTGSYTVVKLPEGFDSANLIIKTNDIAVYIPEGDASALTNVSASMTAAQTDDTNQ